MFSNDFNNLFNTISPKHRNPPALSPNSSQTTEGLGLSIETRTLKHTSLGNNAQYHPEQPLQKLNAKPLLKIGAHNQSLIINRAMKFCDCIGLIHYCRLCYKLACLLD
jgi:hypothetical protein